MINSFQHCGEILLVYFPISMETTKHCESRKKNLLFLLMDSVQCVTSERWSVGKEDV